MRWIWNKKKKDEKCDGNADKAGDDETETPVGFNESTWENWVNLGFLGA